MTTSNLKDERAALLADHIELNMSNYGPEDVDRLNAWAIDAYDFIVRATQASEVEQAPVAVFAQPDGEDPMRFGDRSLDASVKRLTQAYCVQQPLPVPDQMAFVWRFDIGRLRNDWLRLRALADSQAREQSVAPTAEQDKRDAEQAAAVLRKAMSQAWNLGQTYWQQADSDSWKQQDKSEATRQKYLALVEETVAALAATAQSEGES